MALSKSTQTGAGRLAGGDMDMFHDLFSRARAIQRGRISTVHQSASTRRIQYAYDVELEAGGRTFERVQVASQYFNSARGSGVFTVPEPGAMCLLGWYEGNHPVIIGFLGVTDDDAGYANRRMSVTPGSTVISSPLGASIIVENAGAIIEKASPACMRKYIGTRDTIQDEALKYKMYMGGGFIQWTENEETGDTTYRIRAFVSEEWQNSDFAEIEMGADASVLSIKTGYTSGGEDAIRTEIGVDPTGDLFISAGLEDDSKSTSLQLSADGNLDVLGVKDSKVNIDPDGVVTITGQSGAEIIMDASGKITVKANELEIDAPVTRFTKPVTFDGMVTCNSVLSVNGMITTSQGGTGSFWEPDRT